MNDKKNIIWLAILIIICLSISEYLITTFVLGGHGLFFSIFSGLLGGALGFIIYYLALKFNINLKLVTILLIVLASILFFCSRRNQNYITCDVCGYIAVDTIEEYCTFCFCDTYEAAKKDGYNDYSLWLKEMQLEVFALDSLNQPIQGFTLKEAEEEGFCRDTAWHPLITESDLKQDFIMNYR